MYRACCVCACAYVIPFTMQAYLFQLMLLKRNTDSLKRTYKQFVRFLSFVSFHFNFLSFYRFLFLLVSLSFLPRAFHYYFDHLLIRSSVAWLVSRFVPLAQNGRHMHLIKFYRLILTLMYYGRVRRVGISNQLALDSSFPSTHITPLVCPLSLIPTALSFSRSIGVLSSRRHFFSTAFCRHHCSLSLRFFFSFNFFVCSQMCKMKYTIACRHYFFVLFGNLK